MTQATTKKHHSWVAALGWGGLLLFMGLFAWLIISQLRSAEIWSGRENDATNLVKRFRPDGASGDTMEDLLKKYSAHARTDEVYVGEFTWGAKQRDASDYEVSLLWKEGEDHHVAVWRVDLQTNEVRPQGDEAASLPDRAKKRIGGG
jgi:hypothetical protein